MGQDRPPTGDRPAIIGETISKVLRTMRYGIYIVTSRSEAGPHGMTASWVMQVSLEPQMVAVAVAEGRTTGEIIAQSKVFAVNLLPRDRADIAERFFTPAQRLGHVSPFADYTSGSTGAPLLDDAVAALECRVAQVVNAGDHTLFIGQVVGGHLRSEEAPLLDADAGLHYGR